MSTLLEIVQDCDNFPYHDISHPDNYAEALQSLWYFYLPDDPAPHGFLTDSVVERMPWTTNFRVSTHPRKQVHLLKPKPEAEADGLQCWQTACGVAIQDLVDLARGDQIGGGSGSVFPRLCKKTTEQFPILGARFDIGIERSAFSLFGIIGRGAHMTVYTTCTAQQQQQQQQHHDSDDKGKPLKIWIARRSATKATYPSMLDQAVAGGVARGETPLECIVREAGEEACLAPGYVRDNAVAAGTVSWWNVSDARAGGEVGLMNPGVLYVYDLEVPDTTGAAAAFQPVAGDIDRFSLMGIDEVLVALRRGEFKPSCAMVMLDFLIRHGLITAEDEPDYCEIISRLHRKLPFRINSS